MEIKKVISDKKEFLELLLLAAESAYAELAQSLPSRERGLKFRMSFCPFICCLCRSLRGSVD